MKNIFLGVLAVLMIASFGKAEGQQCHTVFTSLPKIIIETDFMREVLTGRDADTAKVLWTKKAKYFKGLVAYQFLPSFRIGSISPDGTLFSLDHNFRTSIVDGNTGTLLYKISIADVYFDPSGQYILTRSQQLDRKGRDLQVLEARTGEVLVSVKIPEKIYIADRSATFSPDFSANSGTVSFEYSVLVSLHPFDALHESQYDTYYKTIIIDMRTHTTKVIETAGHSNVEF